jgi:hypothetical protein
MGEERLTGERLCKALMDDIHEMIDGNAKRLADHLRYGPQAHWAHYDGRHILALAAAELTAKQIDALEETLRQVQRELVHSFLCLIDGNRQPEGFPDMIRLVDMDTGKPICPGELTWAFSHARPDWLTQHGQETGQGLDQA